MHCVPLSSISLDRDWLLKWRLILSIAFFAIAISIAGEAQLLILTNPLAADRQSEVIEIPLSQIVQHLHIPADKLRSLVATDLESNLQIPTQLYSSVGKENPDLILLLVTLPGGKSIRVSFHLDPVAVPQRALVFGREAAERKDDFAWENEIVAYRVYGPALEATGEITSGIDVWSKRVPNFVIDNFYKRDLEGTLTHDTSLSYHKDNEQGLDSYFVGPTRGCGGTAVWKDGKLVVSKNYTSMKILSQGPIRFAFELTYAPWAADGRTVTETKTITLDAGTHMNKIVSTYMFEGQPPMSLAAGIAIHEGAEAAILSNGKIASVWDTPQDVSAGRISTALISLPSENSTTLKGADHSLMIFKRHSGEPFTYFAGSGWSKADMPTLAAWNRYLASFLTDREHPITFQWVNK